MISSGIEAVLVKVAALGLDPHKHLGRTLAAMEPILHALRDRFGCNVCGEGGEYETLTLDCPAFKRGRIVLDAWEVRMHSPDSVAAVGVLHPTAFHVECKDGGLGAEGRREGALEAVVVEVPGDWQAPVTQAAGGGVRSNGLSGGEQPAVEVRVSRTHVHMMCAPAGAADGSGADATAAAVHTALGAIGGELEGLGLTWDDSLFVHLYLADMSHFGTANAAYCLHLPSLSPPSRACVQLPLPDGVPLMVDVLFARPAQGEVAAGKVGSSSTASGSRGSTVARRGGGPDFGRRVLHVQSISEWAPSCIGPYSQVHGGVGRGLVG